MTDCRCHRECCVKACSKETLKPVQTWLLGVSAMRHVAIGRARAFPLLQTVRATFAAHGFPYSRLLVLFGPRSDLAHQHGTTRCVRSPALPENKAVLLAALSDLGGLLRPALSWQSFVVSSPLQAGLWLLCCLRPLSCTLACSRPTRV